MAGLRRSSWHEKPGIGIGVNPALPYGVLGVWLCNEGVNSTSGGGGGEIGLYNLYRRSFGLGSGSRSAGYGIAGKMVSHLGTDARANLFEAVDAVGWLPTQEITICLGYEKRDATLRNAGVFGSSSTVNTHRMGVLLPFTDGKVYWDFGGLTEDATRESVAGLTTSGYHAWAFTSGPRGMEIWQDGILRSSNTANPTRVESGDAYQIGFSAASSSDLANYYWLFMHRNQLPVNLLRKILLDPYNILCAPQVPRIRISPRITSPSLTPGTGALALTGIAPNSLSEGLIQPEGGSLALSGLVPIVIINISPDGITSAEALGTPNLVSLTIYPIGIESSEGFGTGVRIGDITVPSIASLEAFGTVLLVAGDIAPIGIESEEFVSDFEIIDTPGATGTITLTTGISSEEAFGTTELTELAIISPTGIPSGFDMDLHTVGVGVATISPFGIASEEQFTAGGTTIYQLQNPEPPAAGTVTAKKLCSPIELIRAERYFTTAPNPAFILPDVYGDFRLGGLRGPVPAVLVTQESPWVFVAAAHPVKEITNVYVDDVERVAGFAASPVVALGGGPQVATITFAALPSGEVSWRGQGRMDDDGEVIRNPISQLERVLLDRAGYHSEDFDATAFAEARARAASMVWETAWVFADDRQVQDWITEILFNVMGYWRVSGAAQLQVTLDPGGTFPESDLVGSIVAARHCIDGDDGVEFVADRTKLVNKLVAYYQYGWSAGAATDRAVDLEDVVSINAYEEIRKSVVLRGLRHIDLLTMWSEILFERQSFRTRVEGAMIKFAVRGSLFVHVTVGDLFAFSWPYGPTRELGHGYVNEILRVVEISHDVTRGGMTSVTAADTGAYVASGGSRVLVPLGI